MFQSAWFSCTSDRQFRRGLFAHSVLPTAWQADADSVRRAEFERSMVQERVRAGLRRAVGDGKTLGRPPVTPALRERILEALQRRQHSGEGVRGIAKRMGVGVSTVQRLASSARSCAGLSAQEAETAGQRRDSPLPAPQPL
jgi:hypothetical protein